MRGVRSKTHPTNSILKEFRHLESLPIIEIIEWENDSAMNELTPVEEEIR